MQEENRVTPACESFCSSCDITHLRASKPRLCISKSECYRAWAIKSSAPNESTIFIKAAFLLVTTMMGTLEKAVVLRQICCPSMPGRLRSTGLMSGTLLRCQTQKTHAWASKPFLCSRSTTQLAGIRWSSSTTRIFAHMCSPPAAMQVLQSVGRFFPTVWYTSSFGDIIKSLPTKPAKRSTVHHHRWRALHMLYAM